METEDVMSVAGNAADNLEAPDPLNLAGGGRNEILDSGPAVGSDVEYKEKTLPKEGVLETSELEAVGLGATRNTVVEGGDEKKGEGGMLVKCTAESSEAELALERMPSGGVSNVVQDITVTDTVAKDAGIDARYEAQAGVIAGEEVTDSVMKDVVIEAAIDVSSPVNEDAIALGETQSIQVDSAAEVSKRSDTKINGSVMKSLENLTVIQDSRKDADRYRISSSSIAEVVAAGVAAGVAEGIAESIAETIAKETAGACGQGSMEGRLFDSGRFERMAIAKAVAEVIAESVAQEVAQGLADGLAEVAATAEAFNGVEQKKPDNTQGMAEANKDGVFCDCGFVAVVRVVGEKSPNRGLRYLMCSRQEPSFFKRKGKRKDSDTIGKCKFFRWLDTPRHTSKEDKKNQEKEKTQLEDLNASLSTRSSAKKSNLESPTAVGAFSSGDGVEVSPSEMPTPRNTDDSLSLPEAPESTPDLKPAQKQRKRGLAEESGRDDILVADRPASAGTLTRSALRKGAPEPVQEPSLDTSAVSTPVSVLGKRTIDWTDSYIGPESQVFEKGVSFRKRRSVRGESGPSSRYSIGGSGSGRNPGFGSSEKKPLHYFRRSTGQIGASDGEPINLSSPQPLTDVESPGAGQKDERDNRFKSYYKKGKVGSSLEPKSKSMSGSTSDKLQLGAGKSRVNRTAEEVPLVETEKKTKSQTRRQQRKLPLSEVYGAMEPLLPMKVTRKGTNILVAKDHSLSPSRQSFGKGTPSNAALDPKEAVHSKSPPKKRKLSWVLSEDSVVQETDTSNRTSARKSNSSAHINSGGKNSLFSMVETPLLASAFPTVRYEAKLPAEDYHDPDDPWSLEIPWAKQEHEEEKAQQLETEKGTCKDEGNWEAVEGGDSEVKMDVGERIEALNEAPATGEELPVSVPEPAELTGFENSGGIYDQEVGDILKENHVDVNSISATEEELPNSNTLISGNSHSPVHSRSDIADRMKSCSTHQDQEATPEGRDKSLLSREHKFVHSRLCSDTVSPHSTREDSMLLQNEVEGVQRSEGFAEFSLDNGSLLSASEVCGQSVQKDQVVENVQELIVGGMNQEDVANRDTGLPSPQAAKYVSKVPDEEVAILQGRQTSVAPDEQTTGDKAQTSMLAAQTGTEVKAGEHESLMSESAIMKVSTSIDESGDTALDKTDPTIPLEQLPSNDSRQSTHVGEAATENAVMREDNVLLGSVATVSKDSLSKLDDTLETDTILHRERSELPGALSDAAVTNEMELVLSGGGHGVDDFQGNVKVTDGPIEEPAISGSNLRVDGGPDSRVGQVNNHEPERDLAHTSLDQDAAIKSPREADNAGAAAASENAGFVNSVWRLASGKKTRSIGSIGAPAVTSKRSRSVVPSQKGGPKKDPKHQADIQWVDVPLDWRNEKSTGRVPLLPNFPGKGLNGSDTTQSELRLLQSADTSQGTHSARPRLGRGEVDDSSIITEEKEKGHDACNEDSTDYNAQITNVAAHARQATLGSTAMGDEASIPAGDHGLVGGPTNQQAGVSGGDNAVQKRKRGRPRKDSKKPVGLQYSVAGGHKVDAAGGVNQTPEPELAGVVGKVDGEPSSMIICSTTMEGNALTELNGEDRVSQLERSASNTERENGKPEGGVSSEPDECGRSLDGTDVPSATLEGLPSEIVAPHCLCKVVPRQAILKTVVRSGDPNQGLRYWSCSNYRKLFTKKRKPPSDVTEESCNYFRWLDTPRVTAKDKREARKERYRQVELQRLL